MTKKHRIAHVLVPVVLTLVAAVAVAQPVTGIAKRPPLSGNATASSPLQIDGCGSNVGYTQVWNGSAYQCGVAGGGSDKLGPDGNVGDATVGGAGTTLTINNAAVTLAKMADIATSRFICRVTAGTGSPEACTTAQATSLLDLATTTLKGLVPAPGSATGKVLSDALTWISIIGLTDGDKGDVVVSGSGATWMVDTGVITLVQMANLTQNVILGRNAGAGTGAPQALTPAQVAAMLPLASTSLQGLAPARSGSASTYLDGTGAYSTPVGAGDVTDVSTTAPMAINTTQGGTCTSGNCQVNLRSSATNRFFGRVTAGAGNAEELSGTTATAILDVATTTTKGLVPAPGTATGKVLSDALTWVTPGGGPGTGTANRIPVWATTTTLGDSPITVSGSNVTTAGTISDSVAQVVSAVGSGLSKTTNTVTLALGALTCGAGQHFSGVTATGTFTCSADTTPVGVTSFATSGATNTDIAPTSWTNATGKQTAIRITFTAGSDTIGGLAASGAVDGQVVDLLVVGTQNGYLLDEVSGASTYKFRSAYATDILCKPGDIIRAQWLSSATRWVVQKAGPYMPSIFATGNIQANGGGTFATVASTGFVTGGYVQSNSSGANHGVYAGANSDAYLASVSSNVGALGFAYLVNGAATGYINSISYLEGTTQARSLEIDDGQGTGATHAVATFGANGAVGIGQKTSASGGVTLGSSTNPVAVSGAATLNLDTTLASGVRFKVKGNAPTLTGCGTGATVIGDSTGGHVNVGTSPSATCAIAVTFNSSTPSCTFNSRSASAKGFGVTSINATGITLNTVTASTTYDWHCDDHY